MEWYPVTDKMWRLYKRRYLLGFIGMFFLSITSTIFFLGSVAISVIVFTMFGFAWYSFIPLIFVFIFAKAPYRAVKEFYRDNFVLPKLRAQNPEVFLFCVCPITKMEHWNVSEGYISRKTNGKVFINFNGEELHPYIDQTEYNKIKRKNYNSAVLLSWTVDKAPGDMLLCTEVLN